MTILVNGHPRDVPSGMTVRELIEILGLGGQPCAAEVNSRVVSHRHHLTHVLNPGDRIELVSLVGGG